ncbi:MAG: SPOR domain-containing protein, partial [Bacilli bacterium]
FVQVGAYSKRENAENQLQKAKDAGFVDAFLHAVSQTNSRI